MCFPNRIDGEQAIYKSLEAFSLSFAKRESSRITSIAFWLSVMKPKPVNTSANQRRGNYLKEQIRIQSKTKQNCKGRGNTRGCESQLGLINKLAISVSSRQTSHDCAGKCCVFFERRKGFHRLPLRKHYNNLTFLDYCLVKTLFQGPLCVYIQDDGYRLGEVCGLACCHLGLAM